MIEVKQRPYRYNFSGNSIYYELYSAEAAQDSKITFQADIMFKRADAAGFGKLLPSPLRFTPIAGKVLVNISDYLDSMLEYDVPPITANQKDFFITGKQSGQFYITFQIVHADTGPRAWNATEEQFSAYVLKGGVNPFHFRGNNFWVNYWETGKPLLTWQPAERLASISERIYLAWFQTRLFVGSLTLNVQVFYTDGSDFSTSVDLLCEFGKVVYFPTGAAQLALDQLQVQKQMLKWQVQLGAQNGINPFEPLSEKFTYHLDNRKDYNEVTLNYRNSLGGLDSVRIRGEIERQADYKTLEAQNILSPAYFADTVLPAENAYIDSLEQITYKGRITQLTREEADRIRDLFQQREVWWMKKNRWWPVKVTTTTLPLGGSSDKRWGVPIEWQIASDGARFYTPESINLGEGVQRSNTCGATVTSITTSVTHSSGTATAKHLIAINVPAGDEVLLVKYWIPGVMEKRDHWLFNGNEITTTHPQGQSFTIFVQTVCKNGLEGVPFSKTYATNFGGGGPIILDPIIIDPNAPGQHRIVNNTGIAAAFVLRSPSGFQIAGDLPAIGSLPLPPEMIGQTYNGFNLTLTNMVPADVTLFTGNTLVRGSVLSGLGGSQDATVLFKSSVIVVNFLEIAIS